MNIHPSISLQLIIKTVASKRPVNNHFATLYDKNILMHPHPDFPLISCKKELIMPSSSYVIKTTEEMTVLSQREWLIEDLIPLRAHQLENILENAVMNDDKTLLNYFKTVMYTINDLLVHTLSYTKNYNESYKAAIPIPSVPSGLRAYDGSTWFTLSQETELKILPHLKEKFNNFIHSYSPFISGIVSTIDGNMRLRIKITESDHHDARIKHRGRMITTFVKKDLITIASILINDDIMKNLEMRFQQGYRVSNIAELHITPNKECSYFTVSVLKKVIERKLINRNLYIII
jgi:hypothetical protein